MKDHCTILFVLLSFFATAQTDTSQSQAYLTRITMDVTEVQDPLLFASSIDISIKPSKGSVKYATHSLLGSMDLGDVRTVQLDLLSKKMTQSDIVSSLIYFSFKSRSVDDFIGVFNFMFEFSDGTNYPYRLGKISIGNDLKLSTISRTIYIR